ncbi:MAG: AAA family ATPase [Bacilli bacterium]|nr:AAA family ATPase [Bacilli bacterium]
MTKRLDDYEVALASGLYLRRQCYKELLEWKNTRARDHVACFLKGARRVGKSVLALELAHKEYRSFLKISFDEAPDSIKDLFVNGLDNLDEFYDRLMIHYDTSLYPGESLVILDEVQLFKPARQAIKTLLLDGRYDILETGSLASVVKSDDKEKTYLLPSEEDTIEVNPLSFSEFLDNDGQTNMIDVLKKCAENNKQLLAAYHPIYRKFREYLIVGGMPMAVRSYLLTRDFQKVEKEKKSIIDLYRNDLLQQKLVNPVYATSLFELIPSELSHHDSRFRYSHAGPNARERDYIGPMKWLVDAGLAKLSYPVNDPSPLPLLSLNPNEFKAYLLDTGLLYSLSYSNAVHDELFYKRLLLDTLHVNEGMFVENYVATALVGKGNTVCYYVKRNKETYKTIMEVDFICMKNSKMTPIEVKSSDDYSHISLTKFKKTFQSLVNQGVVLYDGDVKKEGEIYYYPVFMFDWLF